MERNVGRLDQFFRIFLGLALIAYIFRSDEPMNGWPILGIIGLILLASAAMSRCLLYSLFGISTVMKSDDAV